MTHDDIEGENTPMLSRTGVRGPFGNLDERLATLTDYHTAELFRQKANEAGMDASSAIRDWVYLIARGERYTDFCAHEAKVKAAKLFGTGHEQGMNRGGK